MLRSARPLALRNEIVLLGPTVASSFGVAGGVGFGVGSGGGLLTVNRCTI